MELKNCEKCGRVFAYTGETTLCSRCNTEDEETDFKKVRDYLYEYPGATVPEVAEATKVSEKQILKFLRESRIEISNEDSLMLDCERCGTSIKHGRFCNHCIAEMKREFTQVLEPSKEEKAEKPKLTSKSRKMYVAEMRKKRR